MLPLSNFVNIIKDVPIIILHGWGLNGSVYMNLSNLLKVKGYEVFFPDMPGFGKELLRKKEMNLDDYVEFVRNFMKKKKIKRVILFGHSFGGRISIKLAVKYPNEVLALILTGVPGVKQKLSPLRTFIQYYAVSLGETFRIKALSSLKNILRKGLYFLIGEWDYYNAGNLRETFKKVIAEDLTPYLKRIKTPTLLLWGEYDRVVPLSIALRMKKYIPGAKLIVYKKYGHKLPYEAERAVADRAHEFLKNL